MTTNTPVWQLSEIDLQLIKMSFAEDLSTPFFDATLAALDISSSKKSQANIVSKHNEPIVVCGLAMMRSLCQQLSQPCDFSSKFNDGDILQTGETLLTLNGSLNNLLMGERTFLNFLRHLCGVATLTRKFVDKVSGTQTKILDTRKTTPGFRHLEKYAVTCGGGCNHRQGLYDAIMIKDTHIDLLGGVEATLKHLPILQQQTFPVIVEVRSQDELSQVIQFGKDKVNRVLLDNMKGQALKDCVAMCQGVFATEASGNLSLETIKAVAEAGVDFASVGMLTHSAGDVDLSMKALM